MTGDQIIDATMAQSVQSDAARTYALSGWLVMRDPPDYAGKVIARLLTTEGQAAYVLVADCLAGLQAMLPSGLVRSDRQAGDLPELVEIWFTG